MRVGRNCGSQTLSIKFHYVSTVAETCEVPILFDNPPSSRRKGKPSEKGNLGRGRKCEEGLIVMEGSYGMVKAGTGIVRGGEALGKRREEGREGAKLR